MTFKENGVCLLYNKENAEKLKRGKNEGALLQEAMKNPGSIEKPHEDAHCAVILKLHLIEK